MTCGKNDMVRVFLIIILNCILLYYDFVTLSYYSFIIPQKRISKLMAMESADTVGDFRLNKIINYVICETELPSLATG